MTANKSTKSSSKKSPAKKNRSRRVIEIHDPVTGKLAGSRSTAGMDARDIPKANGLVKKSPTQPNIAFMKTELKKIEANIGYYFKSPEAQADAANKLRLAIQEVEKNKGATPSKAKKVDLSQLSFFEKIDLAKYRKTTDETLRALSREEDLQIRMEVALNSKTSDSLKLEMAKQDLDIGEFVAEDINASAPVLRELARTSILSIEKDLDSRANSILEVVASHRSAPKDLLVELAKSPYFEIRLLVAENSNTPLRTLVELSDDKSPYVRGSVPLNPNTTSQLLEKLSKDQEWAVRREVAFNEKTPERVLLTLADEPLMDFRLALVQNNAFPSEGLIKLSQHKEFEVVALVIKHPNVNAKVLTQLAKQYEEAIDHNVVLHVEEVKYRIYSHPKTPAKIKSQLKEGAEDFAAFNHVIRSGRSDYM